jgi:hypothetical protein
MHLRTLAERGPHSVVVCPTPNAIDCMQPMSPPMSSPASSYPGSLHSSLSHSVNRLPLHMPVASSPPTLPVPGSMQGSLPY